MTLKGRLIIMSTEIEVNNCFVICLLTLNEFFSTFPVEVIFNLRTFSQVLATFIKLF